MEEDHPPRAPLSGTTVRVQSASQTFHERQIKRDTIGTGEGGSHGHIADGLP